MRVQRKESRNFLIFLLAILVLGIISYFSNSFAMKHYEETDFTTGLVTANALNVRCGPSLSYKVISKVYKNQYIRVFAKIDNWYIIQTDKDIIGAVSADYIKPIYPSVQTNTEEAVPEEDKQEANETKEEDNPNIVVSSKDYTSQLTQDEQEVFELINQKRIAEGLDTLKIDDDLQNVCRLKAQEMVEKNYFSHTSPTYGSTFEMIKNNQITYKVAGENIAGNSENARAVDAWMNSENHKANIINRSYNYTGVAVVDSPKYGKIYVQIFIGR